MRWIVRIFGVLVSLVVVAVAALFLIPAERIAGIASSQFLAATGRTLTIEGSVRPSIYPVIGARVEAVTLANADWSTAGPMLRAEAVDLGLDLAALMRGEVVIRRFEARAPQILLERAADGRGNWEFGTGAGEGTGAGSAMSGLSLDLAEVSGASLRFVDHGGGIDLALEGVDAELRLPAFDGPGTLRMSGRSGGQGFEAELRIGAVGAFLAGEVAAITASLRAGESRAGFEGRAGLSPVAFDGQVTLDARTLAPLMALAGQGGGDPLPAAARPLVFSGQAVMAPAGSLHLRNGTLGFGANRLALALDIATDGPRPRLTGEVSATQLDLRPFTGGDGAAGAAPGWSRDPIDASALGMADASVSFMFGPVQTGVVDLTAARGVMTIDRARAVFDLREVRLFEGLASGEFVLNNRSGLSVGGNLRAADIALLPLLRQLAGFERLTGTGTGTLRFLGVGNSMDAIMRSLSGEGALDFGRGEIRGLDLAGMLRNLDMSYMGEGQRTIYDSISGSFTIQNGILRNDDMRLAASLVSVEGRGTVDLGGRVLDYRVTPVALRDAATGQGIRVPLLVTGPWDAPRFRLDLEGLAEQRLLEERERIEAAAREQIQRLESDARERLGIGTQTEGGEGGLEGIGRGLLQLFGGSGN